MTTSRPPSIDETSFECPHCGALAKQFWSTLWARDMPPDDHPRWLSPKEYEKLVNDEKDDEKRLENYHIAEKIQSLRPFLCRKGETGYGRRVRNLHISSCHNCREIALWKGQGLIWPTRGSVPRPNADMRRDALVDYEEASEIVDQSPRGAAALLRLAIQKICIALGCEGQNLNSDIGLLVAKGLDVRVQQALDVVRVVGNNAVHPGEL